MSKRRVLVVDDEPGMLEVCVDSLELLSDAVVETESDSIKARERISSEHWDLLIADVRMPKLGGVGLLRAARENDPDLMVLMMTAFPSVESAVESMKLGAADYITKPFRPEDLCTAVHSLLEQREVRDENRLLRRSVEGFHRMGEMVGRCEPMQKVFETIERVAPTELDVLIVGETGTGKELVARTLHRLSPRSAQRFVPVDCGAIPEELLESEFFGHEKGAFSGANTRSLGLLEFAHKGTFFLDEIGHLPAKLQVKLLRALQERRFRRLGANEEIDVDVRVVAATSLDLEQEIAKGRFRSELYYRVNVGRLDLPPLRSRRPDIPLLVEYMIRRFATEVGRKDVRVSAEALEILCGYHWPGNARELQNVIRRSLVNSRDGEIQVDDLPDEIVTTANKGSVRELEGFHGLREQQVNAFERKYLEELLRNHGGDVSNAAATAKLPRGTLYRLLKKHGFDPGDFRT